MTQLVFVHGVAARDGTAYQRQLRTRDQFFREIVFPDVPIRIENAYWGADASIPAWGLASLPVFNQPVKAFSLSGGLGMHVGAAPSRTVAELAQSDFPLAIDALFSCVVETAEQQDRELTAQELVQFSAAGAYAQSNPKPFWYQPGMSDAAFLAKLGESLAPAEPKSFGLANLLSTAASNLASRARNLVSTGLTAVFREELNRNVAQFLGDVFVYLKFGDKRKAIRNDVLGAIKKVCDAKKANEPIILVGHSLGGVILVDILSDPVVQELKGFKADLLLTVGSQPGFFEEMKLFAASRSDVGPGQLKQKVEKLDLAKRWWNVFDPVDLLSFQCAPIFEGVEDFKFSSVVGLIDAHTSYFKRPTFFQRLHERVKQEGFVN